MSSHSEGRHIFAGTRLGDGGVGGILLVLSLGALVVCLIGIVKTLNALLRGPIALAIRRTVNSDFPQPFG